MEYMMLSDFDSPHYDLSHLLEQASAITGFSAADIAAMVNSELDTDQLLEYITAVITDRMN
jgi:hypothetical protein